jgi:hypothetical protein
MCECRRPPPPMYCSYPHPSSSFHLRVHAASPCIAHYLLFLCRRFCSIQAWPFCSIQAWPPLHFLCSQEAVCRCVSITNRGKQCPLSQKPVPAEFKKLEPEHLSQSNCISPGSRGHRLIEETEFSSGATLPCPHAPCPPASRRPFPGAPQPPLSVPG